MQLKKIQKEKGFTLIEMLVSVALFAMVLTVTLSSILTIADANKKARSLMSVMNNLNFAVDSMTRSFKSGNIDGSNPVTSSGKCLSTDEIDYAESAGVNGGFETRTVQYCWDEVAGSLTKQVEGGQPISLTSSDVDIDYLEFVAKGTALGSQPIVSIRLEGTVKVSERIRSSFTIQTSVSQRQLNI